MNCNHRSEKPNFYCLCNLAVEIDAQILSHLSKCKIIEPLDISLSLVESQLLKNQIFVRIEAIEKGKQYINSLSHNLIRKIKEFRKNTAIKLDAQVENYLKFLSLQKLSKSIKIEADKIISSNLLIDQSFFSIKSEIEESFKEFIHFKNREIDKKAPNKEESKKNSSRDLNSLPLDEKLDYLKTLKIDFFEKFLFKTFHKINELKISNDEKYAFFCKNLFR